MRELPLPYRTYPYLPTRPPRLQDELIAELGSFKGEMKREIEQLRDSHEMTLETILCGLASAFEPRGEVCAAAAAPALTPGVAVNTGAPSAGTVARVAGARRRAGEERGAAVPARKAGAAGKVGDSLRHDPLPQPPPRPAGLRTSSYSPPASPHQLCAPLAVHRP